jgi:hypothetical protein
VGIALNRAFTVINRSAQVRAAAGTASLEVSHLRMLWRHRLALGQVFVGNPRSMRAAWNCEPESRIIVMEKLRAHW